MKLLHQLLSIMQVVSPALWAKIKYYRHYKKPCNLKDPQTFSEKLLWLWLNDYRNNITIMQMDDKYDVRKYIEECGLEKILNEVYFVTDDVNEVHYEDLPDSFALKLSQGWNANLICENKEKLNPEVLYAALQRWSKGQLLYDLGAAKIGGIKLRELPKHYICERYLGTASGETPNDYKIYCFHGDPVAILYIADRTAEKKGCFLRPDWSFLSDLDYRVYKKLDVIPPKPVCLEEMIQVARIISKPFPFVRVDLYVVDDKPIFGETTFFPSGCIGMQETEIDGVSMGEMLHISTKNKRKGV